MASRVHKAGAVEKILTAAADLFYLHGLRGVGVEQIVERSGVAKSTLYVHFRTKEKLVAAYLRQADDAWTARLAAAAAAAGPDAADRLVAIFDALLDDSDRLGFIGCPFVSAAVESTLDSEARAIAIRHTRRRRARLAKLCADAGAVQPEALARQIGLLLDGALVGGRLLQNRAAIVDAKAAAACLVESHQGTARRAG